MTELITNAETEELENVLEFVNRQIEVLNCDIKTETQIAIAVEELFVNIAHYAYAPGKGKATIRVNVTEDPAAVEITFIDSGIPYDPLAKPDPDTTLSVEKRQIGGLGIYMVKKSMDSVVYEYKDGHNILTIKKIV